MTFNNKLKKWRKNIKNSKTSFELKIKYCELLERNYGNKTERKIPSN